MSLPPEADTQLPLKKRARRRLVGAIALAVLAAVVLPMVMDQTPQSPVADVQIRIPGQEQVPAFSTKGPAAKTGEPAKAEAPVVAEPVAPLPAAPVAKPLVEALAPVRPEAAAKVEKTADKAPEKAADKPAAKSAEKPAEKAAPATPDKSAGKPADKAKSDEDARRAASILSGKTAEPAKAAPSANGEFVVLIGAFANQANVKQLQTRLGEVGVKTYTEPLDSPQGKKTRVRAGPFQNREAADKALDKMKRIGVNGVVAAKQ